MLAHASIGGFIKRDGLLNFRGERKVLAEPPDRGLLPHFLFPLNPRPGAGRFGRLADFVDLGLAENDERGIGIFDAGHGIDGLERAAVFKVGRMLQLWGEAERESELVVFADDLGIDVRDPAGTIGEVHQALVSGDEGDAVLVRNKVCLSAQVQFKAEA